MAVEASTRRATAIRVVEAAGTPREAGRAHGEAARDLIAAGLDRWLARIGRDHPEGADAYLAGFLAATDFLPAVRRHTPDLLEEVAGVAEGAGQPFARILAFNLLDEEWEHDKATRLPSPGCTVVGLARDEAGTPVLAQTMDIPDLHDGTQIVLRVRAGDAPETQVLAYAGMLGLTGANAAGVGVVVNNLEVLRSAPDGLPVVFVTRGILARERLADAAAFVLGVPHATGQHYAVGDPGGVRAFEGWGGGVAEVPTGPGRYTHANHPLASDALRGDPEPAYRASRTRERQAAVARPEAAATQAAVETLLEETAVPVSRDPAGGYMTFGAVSMALSRPPRLRVAAGPPHRAGWVDVGWRLMAGG